jgi:hypothetical protein
MSLSECFGHTQFTIFFDFRRLDILIELLAVLDRKEDRLFIGFTTCLERQRGANIQFSFRTVPKLFVVMDANDTRSSDFAIIDQDSKH